MKKTDDNPNDARTRDRLLKVAGEVFAERGFRAATVREISRRAKANVAAINYHFRDKQRLYAAVIRHWAEIATQRHPLDAGLTPKASAEERLRVFVHTFMLRLLDEDRPSWHGRLMAREMAEPTRAMDMVIRDYYRPVVDHLRGIVQEIVGSGARDAEVYQLAFSILGQCLYYHHARHAIARLLPKRVRIGAVAELADHVLAFSLPALRAYATAERTSKK